MGSRFYALDFDRTAGRTERIGDDFLAHVTAEDSAVGEALRASKAEVEASRGSFDMLSVLREHMGVRALSECVADFVDRYRNPDRYLEDGVQDLILGTAQCGDRLGILTYGGEDWQTAKLRVTELDEAPRMILGKKGIKGALLASWYDPESRLYRLPQEFGGDTVEEVVLVDDKPEEFQDLPVLSSARGYLFTGGIKPTVDTSPQPAVGKLPPNVTPVASLHEIVQREGLKT